MPLRSSAVNETMSMNGTKYSVAIGAVGRPVEVRAYADRIDLRRARRVVGGHPRCFGRDQTVFDPWLYEPVLARKPGASRNGAPFKNWVLPAGLDRIRPKLAVPPTATEPPREFRRPDGLSPTRR